MANRTNAADAANAVDAAPLPRSPELMRAADTALLVVDVQRRLLPAIAAARVVWNCRRLLDGARILGLPSALTEQNPAKLGRTVAELAAAHASGGAAADPAAKMELSCGACGSIYAAWRDAGIERVLICGIETHVCVAQTAFDLMAAGYQTFIAVDAVGSRATLDHDTALRRMDSAGATLTTVEAALFEWCERAGTPEFRQISALVKELPPGS